MCPVAAVKFGNVGKNACRVRCTSVSARSCRGAAASHLVFGIAFVSVSLFAISCVFGLVYALVPGRPCVWVSVFVFPFCVCVRVCVCVWRGCVGSWVCSYLSSLRAVAVDPD